MHIFGEINYYTFYLFCACYVLSSSSSFLFFLTSQCHLASEGFLGNMSQLDDYCKEKGFAGWFETSAKENIGIDEAARCLVAKVSREKEREREEGRKERDGSN